MRITKDSYFLFSGGEVHTKLPDGPSGGHITCTDYSMNGFMALAQIKQMNDKKGFQTTLTYPYLPYARQDRWMAVYEPFSLKVFCDMLNALRFSSVRIFDPHSDVAPALLNNCDIVPQWGIAREALPDHWFTEYTTAVLFVSPDAGAYKKLSKLVSDDSRILIGSKHRDALGKITGTQVHIPEGVNIAFRHCVLVDDICDGGRTFIELAKVLVAKGAEVSLYVTHGIFSQGLQPLFDAGIKRIFTTNSFDQSKYAKEILEGTLVVKEIC